MEQVYQYIKRLLVFGLCVFLYFFSVSLVPAYLSIPVLLLAFSLLHARITGEKPPHLFAFYRTDNYFKKGGLRDLIRIFVTLFGFVYDAVIWTIWGVYLVFLLFIDLLDLLKTIFYWIIHAILWFLRQYVPFIILLFRLFIHYLIRWPWWLYQIAYFNIRYAYNKNAWRIALVGTLLAGLILFVFYFLELFLVPITGITFIGAIIALLPLTWSFGEIAALRVQKMEEEKYAQVKVKFQNGIEAVRSILFYITLFVVLLLAQLGLNLLGWIPESGITLGGFVFNINSLISLLLIFVSLLIVLGVVILPSYRLYNNFSEIRTSDSLKLLGTLCRKILQYLVISIPNAIFSVVVIVIPIAVLFLAAFTTYSLKNFTVDLRIESLKTQQAAAEKAVEAYITGKKIEHLEYLKLFPLDLSQDFQHREILTTELAFAEEDLKSDQEEALRHIEVSKKEITRLQEEIADPANLQQEFLKEQLTAAQTSLKAYEEQKETELGKLSADIDFLKQRKKQIPVMYFFGGLWLVIFGSLAFAFIVSYLGNTYHQLFIFRNDDTPTEWTHIVKEIHEKDPKQPLLGGTLFIVTVLLTYLVIAGTLPLNNLFDLLRTFLTF